MTSEEITAKKRVSAAKARSGRSDYSGHAAESDALESRNLDDPQLYINREISLLAFQPRVLEEA